MILTHEEVEERLSSPDNLINCLVEIRKRNPGKVSGAKNIPPMVRELVGSLANESNEEGKDIAEVFGISQPVVSSASRGMISTSASRFDPELAAKVKVEDKIDSAHELAVDAMVASLGLLTTKLTEVTKPRELSRIATDMSKIASNLKGNKDGSPVKVNVVLFAPNRMREESEYEVLEAKAV